MLRTVLSSVFQLPDLPLPKKIPYPENKVLIRMKKDGIKINGTKEDKYVEYTLPERWVMRDVSTREDLPKFYITDENGYGRYRIEGAWKGAYDNYLDIKVIEESLIIKATKGKAEKSVTSKVNLIDTIMKKIDPKIYADEERDPHTEGFNRHNKSSKMEIVPENQLNVPTTLLDEHIDPDEDVLFSVIRQDSYIAFIKLIKKGVDINKTNKHGDTPLIFSVKRGFTTSMIELVNLGAKLNEKDKNGNTALMTGAINGDLSAVLFLVEKGADRNVRNNEGKTPYMVACEKGDRVMMPYLESKIDVNRN